MLGLYWKVFAFGFVSQTLLLCRSFCTKTSGKYLWYVQLSLGKPFWIWKLLLCVLGDAENDPSHWLLQTKGEQGYLRGTVCEFLGKDLQVGVQGGITTYIYIYLSQNSRHGCFRCLDVSWKTFLKFDTLLLILLFCGVRGLICFFVFFSGRPREEKTFSETTAEVVWCGYCEVQLELLSGNIFVHFS